VPPAGSPFTRMFRVIGGAIARRKSQVHLLHSKYCMQQVLQMESAAVLQPPWLVLCGSSAVRARPLSAGVCCVVVHALLSLGVWVQVPEATVSCVMRHPLVTTWHVGAGP
jgi:hypothetical protein